jgi:hypothetical protein
MLLSILVRTAQQTRHLLFEAVIDGSWLARLGLRARNFGAERLRTPPVCFHAADIAARGFRPRHFDARNVRARRLRTREFGAGIHAADLGRARFHASDVDARFHPGNFTGFETRDLGALDFASRHLRSFRAQHFRARHGRRIGARRVNTRSFRANDLGARPLRHFGARLFKTSNFCRRRLHARWLRP